MRPDQAEFIIHPAGVYSGLPYSGRFLEWIGWKRDQFPIRLAVARFGIQTSEHLISTSIIERVAVRNDMDDAPSIYPWLRKKLHPVAYRIDVECRHICYIIASGLSEEDANSICTDIYHLLAPDSGILEEVVVPGVSRQAVNQ